MTEQQTAVKKTGRKLIPLEGRCRFCQRATRKPTQTLAQMPNTVKGSDATGTVCITCSNSPHEGIKGRWLDPALPKAEHESRIQQARADLKALIEDRRARGISPTGIYFEGDPAPTRKLGSGHCKRGHEYEERNRASDGRMRCPACEKQNRLARRAAQLEESRAATYSLAS